MSNEVELISDDTLVPIRSIVNCQTGYILPSSGRSRRLMPDVTMRVTAGELRELFFSPGGSILLQNYINVGNKSLAAEFGVPYDAIEYDWTEADVKKCLTEDETDVLLDALDFAPQGIIETLKDDAIKLEINDRAKIKAIADKQVSILMPLLRIIMLMIIVIPMLLINHVNAEFKKMPNRVSAALRQLPSNIK